MGEPSTLRISHYNDTLEPTEPLGILFGHARKLVFKFEFSTLNSFKMIKFWLILITHFGERVASN